MWVQGPGLPDRLSCSWLSWLLLTWHARRGGVQQAGSSPLWCEGWSFSLLLSLLVVAVEHMLLLDIRGMGRGCSTFQEWQPQKKTGHRPGSSTMGFVWCYTGCSHIVSSKQKAPGSELHIPPPVYYQGRSSGGRDLVTLRSPPANVKGEFQQCRF